MTDKLWLLPFGPDQIHLPALHSPDSAGFLIPDAKIARGFTAVFSLSRFELPFLPAVPVKRIPGLAQLAEEEHHG